MKKLILIKKIQIKTIKVMLIKKEMKDFFFGLFVQ